MKQEHKEYREETYQEKVDRWAKSSKQARKFAKQAGLLDKAKREAGRIFKEKHDAIHGDY